MTVSHSLALVGLQNRLRRTFALSPLTRPAVHAVNHGRSERLAERLFPHLEAGQRVLDVGTGLGCLAHILRERGLMVVALDRENIAVCGARSPVLGDGVALPFRDNTFDAALLVTVLHHTLQPDRLLRECRRVATRTIVVEDVYTTDRQRRLTLAADSLINMEFAGHPHMDQDAAGWRSLFADLGFRVHGEQDERFWLLFQSALFVLAPAERTGASG